MATPVLCIADASPDCVMSYHAAMFIPSTSLEIVAMVCDVSTTTLAVADGIIDGDGDADAVGPGEGIWTCGGNGGNALLLELPHAVTPSEMTAHKTRLAYKTTVQRF